MSQEPTERRRPKVIPLGAPEPAEPEAEKPAAEKPKTKSKPKKKHARSPRTMVAPEPEPLGEIPFAETQDTPAPANLLPSSRGFRWGAIFFSALFSLISLGIGLWFTQLLEELFARASWLGWAAAGLMGLAGLALLALVVKELTALARLRRLGTLRQTAEQVLLGNGSAKEVVAELTKFYRGRKAMAWPLAALKEHDGEIIDDPDRLELAERELMRPLDGEARQIIATAAKRVSVVTAVNPAPALDVLFTGYQVLAMLRQLAGLYGGRPGSLETFKLARMVVSHLAVTGGLALSDTLVQNLLGHGLAGRLSAKLGEGTVNGIMTARIGLAAMNLCRPLPFYRLPEPGLSDVISGIAFGRKTDPDTD
ncbi:MAG: TIGR01620 family protein [Pseudomonadota bacterium]